MNEAAPKYVEISRRIEEHIQQGRWTGRMPGVRALARDYQTSVVTTSRALQELAERGLIQTVERSGCFVRSNTTATRTAAATSVTAAETWGICLRLTPGPWRQATEATIREGFTAAARRDGCQVRFDLFPTDAPEPELTRMVRGAGVNGLFFLPSRVSEAAGSRDEVLLNACKAAGLPFVLVERNLRGDRPLAADVVGYDDLEAGRTVTRHLVDLGRRPVFVTGSPTSSHQTRRAGYLLALAGTGATPVTIEQPPDVSPKDAYAAVADRILATKADAVLCYQDYTALGVILELLHRGKRVPADVAVAGVEDLPIGNTFALGVTTYAFSSEELALRGFHLMRERVRRPDAPLVRVAVSGRLVVRESTTGRKRARPGSDGDDNGT
ncbi:GntR family transcriptional regulator [Fimbriiglobus ruber]|nr:substrate-binding domain-containing protein [Fimbriiglobus ruber]